MDPSNLGPVGLPGVICRYTTPATVLLQGNFNTGVSFCEVMSEQAL